MTAFRTNYEVIQGSIVPILAIALVDEDGDAVDLTGATGVRIVVAQEFETATASLVMDKAMTITSATGGLLQVAWVSSDTEDITPRSYYAMIEVTMGADQVKKYGPFMFVVQPSVRLPA